MSATTADPALAARIGTMRYGFTGGMYPFPAETPYDEIALWQLERTAELGGTAFQTSHMPETSEARARLRARSEELDIEIEGLARALFAPLGTDPATRIDVLRGQLAWAKEIGMTVVRHGWGRFNINTTRFATKEVVDAQLAQIHACLTSAAVVAEEAGIPIAVENHCDFTGRELAEILRKVDSEWIGCAMDTANGFTVFCDPNDDVEALAEFTITTHIKDMRMAVAPEGFIPVLPIGCKLGEGLVDIPRAIALFAQRAPRPEGLHLITECGWGTWDGKTEDPVALTRDLLEDGVAYLKNVVTSAGGEA